MGTAPSGIVASEKIAGIEEGPLPITKPATIITIPMIPIAIMILILLFMLFSILKHIAPSSYLFISGRDGQALP